MLLRKKKPLMDSQGININTWHVMKNLSKVWESLLILESTKRAKSWNIIRDLTEPEKLKLFQNINIPTYACPSLQSKLRHTSDMG